MTIAKLSSTDLYFESHGSGPPVVLIHGSQGSHLSWWQQVAHLQERHRVIVFDQRGFGASRPKGEYVPGDGPALSRDLRELLEHLGVGERVCIVGQSFGTVAALDYAASEPDRIAGLVLASAYGAVVTQALLPAVERRAKLMSSVPTRLPPRLAQSPEETIPFSLFDQGMVPFGRVTIMDRHDLCFLYQSIAALAKGPPNASLVPVFGSVRQIDEHAAAALRFPALFVGGEEDPIFPPRELELAADAFPNSRFTLIPGAGHSAHFERADRFNAEISAFLATLSWR
jgi:3-oxoadipate enol-lactonase